MLRGSLTGTTDVTDVPGVPGITDVTGITDTTGNNECEFMPPPNSSKCPDDSMSTTLQISQDNGDDEILHKSQSLIKNLLPRV